MILTRLYELATRPGETILDDPALEAAPVPYMVILDKDGGYLGIEERRVRITTPSKKKGAPPKTELDKGVILSVPRPHGNIASQGFARYYADTLPRVLPVADDAKSKRSRATFWEQIEHVARETDDPALKAVAAFGKRLAEDTALAERVKAEVEALTPDPGDRCTFAWKPDNDRPVLGRKAVRDWYSAFFARFNAGKQEAGPVGLCQVTGTVGPIPTSHPIKLQGVPGGMSVGVSLISFDKPAFQHYGLEGAENAGIGFRAADAYGRALVALIKGTVVGNKTTSLRVGGTLFLFWTREPADTSWMADLESADTDHIRGEFASVDTGKRSYADPAENQFYVLALSGNAARAVVRDYLERPLGAVKAAIRKWFDDLRIADPSMQGQPNDRFPLWMLANATALDAERVAPDTHTRLMEAALTGSVLPDSIIVGCLGRLRVPDRDPKKTPFTAARMGLLKLCLYRKEIPVTETLDPAERRPAYVYGRLLAVCAEIQRAALGDVNANVVDRYYGRFSTAPFLVLRRLIDGALDHLKKVRGGEKEWLHDILEDRLTEVLKLAPAEPLGGQMSLVDQARFSIGFFHQKARTAEEIAERIRVKAEKKATQAAQ